MSFESASSGWGRCRIRPEPDESRRVKLPLFLQGDKCLNLLTMQPWAIAKGDTGEYPFSIRFRQFPQSFPRYVYPTRLNVFWSMSLPDENGFPSPKEAEYLEAFENRLVAAVEKDESAWLAAVVTGRSEREFVFYLQQPELFLRRLTRALSVGDSLPSRS